MKLPLRTLLPALAMAVLLSAAHADSHVWMDGLSVTAGEADAENVDAFRIGMQKHWHHDWFKGGAWYLGGYWETELAMMEDEDDSTQEIYALSLTPVLRYQRDARLSSGVSPFAEAGVGLHLLTDTSVGDSDLATAFQFGSLIGVGVGFGGKGQYELTYRFTHISNAAIKDPNDGLDMHLVKLGYNFN